MLSATAVIQQAKPGRVSAWLCDLLARKPKKLAALALANNACAGRPGMARIVWAMLINGELYRRPVAAWA